MQSTLGWTSNYKGVNEMAELVILALTLLILATIGGWINRHSRTAHRLCYMFERIIVKATESIALAIIGGK
jgi:hypothetical protein